MKNKTNSRDLSIFLVLERDHQEVLGLMQKMERMFGKATKEVAALFSQLSDSIDGHTLLEEEVLYPLLEENEAMESFALQAERAHDEMKDYLEKLEELEPLNEGWRMDFQALKRCVQGHIQEEEEIIFPKMCEVFSFEVLTRAGDRIKQMKTKHEAA
jgi:iron-sulfur cluster repair protein YtfE (RIC family)